MYDYFSEIYESIRRNLLRTLLTGFAVAWGIFMLIVLVGAGNGLMNSTKENNDQARSENVWIYPGNTTEPYGGWDKGRPVRFYEEDIPADLAQFPDHLSHPTTRRFLGAKVASYKDNSYSVRARGIYPQYYSIVNKPIVKGRGINEKDITEKRHNVTINSNAEEKLFPRTESIGKQVSIDGYLYTVVGVYKEPVNSQAFLEMPYTTAQIVYGNNAYLDEIAYKIRNLHNIKESDDWEASYRKSIALRKGFSTKDNAGVWIENEFSRGIAQQEGERIVEQGMWVVGILTLISGIVGVSNIMFITVRERRHEFGIRKALGAKPRSILLLIITESITITAIFGYIGLLLGVLATEYMNYKAGALTLDTGQFSFTYFKNPTVELSTALQAMFTLIIAGVLAGIIPAWKASRTLPIEALKAQ